MKSIQTKLILLLLSCVTLSCLVLGGAGIVNSQRVVDEDSARIMNLLCEEKALEIDALLSRIEQSVNTLAAYAEDQLDSARQLKTSTAYVNAYTQKLESVAVNAANNTEGALAVYVRYNPAFTEPTSGLFWSKTALDSEFQRLVPTDFSKYSPEDIEHVGWYYIPVQNGKAIWMDPYLNQNINVQMISYVVPLFVDREAVGVVGMDIDFNVLCNEVDAVQAYDSGFAFLTDSEGTLLRHPELPGGTPLSHVDEALSGAFSDGGSQNELVPYIWQGRESRLVCRNLSNGMRLALTAPAAEIDEARDELILQMLISLVAIAGISIALAVFVARRMSRPLRELTSAAKKVADGGLSITIDCKSRDEVGTLAASFQQTVKHLQRYIEYINGLAYRDGLTGVKNKTAYQEVVNRLEEQIRLGRPTFAVVVLDINNLKAVNDTCGHDFGDMLIIDASKLICKTFQHSPVFRIGGDEFVVILENGDFESYPALLERFQGEMDDYNRSARTGCSISIARGIALYGEGADLTYGDVFRRADNAMYQNKAAMKQRMREQVQE